MKRVGRIPIGLSPRRARRIPGHLPVKSSPRRRRFFRPPASGSGHAGSGRAAFRLRRNLPAVALIVAAGFAAAVEPIHPVPPPPDADPRLVALGDRLFHDIRLSKTKDVSCASCHILVEGGDDGVAVSVGIEGEQGVINSPTVFNADLYVAQFWDGRAETVEDQIDGPIQNPVEMGNFWPDVVATLYEDPGIASEFNALYPGEGITRDTVKGAIGAFVRSLRTTGSRFDQWLAGDGEALSPRELEGYRWFKHYGCHSCHQGSAAGGNFFQVFGVLNDSAYFRERGDITEADRGRFNVTGNKADMHVFKVPSLRMVVHTAPYLHDGSAATLRDAVDAMFTHQLGRTAPDDHKEAIIDFLYTLAGGHPAGPPIPPRESSE